CVDQVRNDAPLVIELNVGLRDNVTVFFPGRQVERVRLEINRTLAALLEFGIQLLGFVLLDVVTYAVIAVTSIHYSNEVLHTTVFNSPVRGLDEPVAVDPRVAAQ